MQKRGYWYHPCIGLLLSCIFVLGACNSDNSTALKSIKKAVDDIWLIDTHEHFTTEGGRMKTEIDFFSLIIGYMQADMLSSGLTNEDLAKMLDNAAPLEERWNIFYPYWETAKNTGYGQCIRITVKGLFETDEINENTFKSINEKMLEANKTMGWYNHVLKEKSRIDVSIIDPLGSYTHPDTLYSEDFFVKVKRFDNFVRVNRNGIAAIEANYGKPIKLLSDYVHALEREFTKAVTNEKIVGIKTGLAYSRKLLYEDVPSDEADLLFTRLYQNTHPLEKDELTKLEDYMMHRVVEGAEKNSLPIQIHTGILSRNFRANPIENTNAIHLSNLFLKYKKAKFVIFHGNYPYMSELSYLAKHYPNVYIDMCWMHIVSPSASRQYLEEWLFTVPSNKIMAFGGDSSIEWAYGHSVMARNIVAEVLSNMVDNGYYTVDEAIAIATRVLRTNAIELYNIKKVDDQWARDEKMNPIQSLSLN